MQSSHLKHVKSYLHTAFKWDKLYKSDLGTLNDITPVEQVTQDICIVPQALYNNHGKILNSLSMENLYRINRLYNKHLASDPRLTSSCSIHAINGGNKN